MDSHFFWMFFVLAIVVGAAFGLGLSNMTGFSVWSDLQKLFIEQTVPSTAEISPGEATQGIIPDGGPTQKVGSQEIIGLPGVTTPAYSNSEEISAEPVPIAPIATPSLLSVSDSDNGWSLGTQGACTDSAGSYTDFCSSLTTITEYRVYGGRCIGGVYDCTLYGYKSCQAGTCTQETVSSLDISNNVNCSDSDGGINFFIKGKCTDYGGVYYDSYDSCAGTNVVNEYYCNVNNRCALVQQDCRLLNASDGFCSDGVCKYAPWINPPEVKGVPGGGGSCSGSSSSFGNYQACIENCGWFCQQSCEFKDCYNNWAWCDTYGRCTCGCIKGLPREPG